MLIVQKLDWVSVVAPVPDVFVATGFQVGAAAGAQIAPPLRFWAEIVTSRRSLPPPT